MKKNNHLKLTLLTMIKPPFSDSDKQFIHQSITQNDGVIIFPTETFYGIGCSALSDKAVEKIYTLKKRKKSSPLLVLINSQEMLNQYFMPVSAQYRDILVKNWPGPLTAILKSKGHLSTALNEAGLNIAVRMTSCEITQQLIDICGVPIVGTSANLSGQKETTNAGQIYPIFQDTIDIYIDGEEAPGGLPSTLVDMTDPKGLKVIRQGVVQLDLPN